jgi:hypothetical protein
MEGVPAYGVDPFTARKVTFKFGNYSASKEEDTGVRGIDPALL